MLARHCREGLDWKIEKQKETHIKRHCLNEHHSLQCNECYSLTTSGGWVVILPPSPRYEFFSLVMMGLSAKKHHNLKRFSKTFLYLFSSGIWNITANELTCFRVFNTVLNKGAVSPFIHRFLSMFSVYWSCCKSLLYCVWRNIVTREECWYF